MEEKPIKVVSILSPYKVVINAGLERGVKVGQTYLIFGLSSKEITDPDTGESLGKIEILRGKGKVIHSQEKLATIESIDKDTSGKRVVKSFSTFQSLMNNPTEETIYNNDIKTFDEVQIGDYARWI